MVYGVAFDCNGNSSKNIVTCNLSSYGAKKTELMKHDQLCLLRENMFQLRSRPEKVQPWAILVLKSL